MCCKVRAARHSHVFAGRTEEPLTTEEQKTRLEVQRALVSCGLVPCWNWLCATTADEDAEPEVPEDTYKRPSTGPKEKEKEKEKKEKDRKKEKED